MKCIRDNNTEMSVESTGRLYRTVLKQVIENSKNLWTIPDSQNDYIRFKMTAIICFAKKGCLQ